MKHEYFTKCGELFQKRIVKQYVFFNWNNMRVFETI